MRDGVGNETDMFGNQNKPNLDRQLRMAELLHITVENLQEFIVDFVEILANNDADFHGLHRDNIDDLGKDFVPNNLGIASQERHIDFVMDIADRITVLQFLVLHRDPFFILEFARTVSFENVQNLTILSDTGRSVHNEIPELSKILGKLFVEGRQFGMDRLCVHRLGIFFKMGFVKLHFVVVFFRKKDVLLIFQNTLCMVLLANHLLIIETNRNPLTYLSTNN